MWDARRYAAAGIGLISCVDRSHAPLPYEPAPDRERFRKYAEKYIDGEQITFAPYAEHRLTEARDDILFSPVHAALMASVFVISPVADLMVARAVTIVLDLLALFFLFQIALRLFGKTAAIVAGVLYATYTPFIASSTMLLLETPTNALLMGCWYILITAGERQRPHCFVLGGVLIGLLALTKPSASLLAIPLLFGFWWQFREVMRPGLMRRALVSLLLPVLLIIAAIVAAASLRYGELTMRDPSYQEAGIRQSSSVAFEGYDLDIVTADFWERSTYSELTSDPIGFAGLFLKKLVRLWYQPYNDFRKSLYWPPIVDRAVHGVILLLGPLALLLLWFSRRADSVWLLALVLYYTVLHVVLHSVSRYSFNALPIVIIGVGWLCSNAWERFRSLRHERNTTSLAVGLLIISAVSFPDVNYLGPGVPQSVWFVWGRLFLGTGSLVGAYWLMTSCFQNGPARFTGKIGATVVALLVSLGFAVSALARDRWAEFELRPSTQEEVLGTRIYLKELPAAQESELLAIALDISAVPASPAMYRLTVGSEQYDLEVGVDPQVEEYYFKKNYAPFTRLCGMQMRELRHYALVNIEPEILARGYAADRGIDISVRLRPDSAGRVGTMNLYGSTLADQPAAWLPSFRAEAIERFVEYGDPRIRQRYEFISDSAKSYYIGSAGAASADTDSRLRPVPGRYHMFLVHGTSDRGLLVY